MAVEPPRPLTDADDRLTFDCGRQSMNAWFHRHALANQTSGASRVTVLAEAGTGRIAGYVTLSAAQIERAFLPKSQQRNQPDPLLVTLLGQLAVDRAFQGQGLATSLLSYALTAALAVSDVVGSIGVITHPLADGVRAFYVKWGFVDLPYDPRRAMMLRIVDMRLSLGARIAR